MALTDEEKAGAKEFAAELCSDPTAYIRLRNSLAKLTGEHEAETFMTILFHLLPQSAKDHVAVELMCEAIDRHENKS